MERNKVCITTKSTLASLLFKGLVTKRTTVNRLLSETTCKTCKQKHVGIEVNNRSTPLTGIIPKMTASVSFL